MSALFVNMGFEAAGFRELMAHLPKSMREHVETFECFKDDELKHAFGIFKKFHGNDARFCYYFLATSVVLLP